MVTAKGEFQYCIFAKKKSPATLARGYLEAKLTLYKKNAFPQEPTIYTASMRIP